VSIFTLHTAILEALLMASSGTESKEVFFTDSLYCDKGLYVDLTGTNCIVYIYALKKERPDIKLRFS